MNDNFLNRIKVKDKVSGFWLIAFLVFVVLIIIASSIESAGKYLVALIIGAIFSFIMAAMTGRSIPEDIAIKIKEAEDIEEAEEEVEKEEIIENHKRDTKTCPYCAETIKRKATKCKHCGSDIAPSE